MEHSITPTSKERLLALWQALPMESWPVGVFLLDKEQRFVAANQEARNILQIREDCQDTSINTLCRQGGFCQNLLAATQRTSTHTAKLDISLSCNQADSTKWARLYCAPFLEEEDVLGYYGIVIDTTEEHELRERMEALTLDVGNVLHAASAALTMVAQALKPTLGYLARQRKTNIEALLSGDTNTVHAWLAHDANRLAEGIEELLRVAGESPRRREALQNPQWEFLEQQIPKLRKRLSPTGSPIPEKSQPAFLRDIVRDVLDTLRRAKSHHLPNETIRKVEQACNRLELTTLLAPLVTSYQAVLQLARPLDALRDFITTSVRPEEEEEELSLAEILQAATKELEEFANARGVEIRLDILCNPKSFRGVRRDLQRAFMNLIHNAIKYTYPRTRGLRPWVTVILSCPQRCGQIPAPCATVVIENWGTPIPEDEIDQGLIFEIGYRGRLAQQRNSVLGTGIGLADTRHVIRRYNGKVEVNSQPASKPPLYQRDEPSYYRQPFLTRFLVHLPLSR